MFSHFSHHGKSWEIMGNHGKFGGTNSVPSKRLKEAHLLLMLTLCVLQRERERDAPAEWVGQWRSSGWLMPNNSCKSGVPVSRRAWEFVAKRLVQGRAKQLPAQISVGEAEFAARCLVQGRVKQLPVQILVGEAEFVAKRLVQGCVNQLPVQILAPV